MRRRKAAAPVDRLAVGGDRGRDAPLRLLHQPEVVGGEEELRVELERLLVLGARLLRETPLGQQVAEVVAQGRRVRGSPRRASPARAASRRAGRRESGTGGRRAPPTALAAPGGRAPADRDAAPASERRPRPSIASSFLLSGRRGPLASPRLAINLTLPSRSATSNTTSSVPSRSFRRARSRARPSANFSKA